MRATFIFAILIAPLVTINLSKVSAHPLNVKRGGFGGINGAAAAYDARNSAGNARGTVDSAGDIVNNVAEDLSVGAVDGISKIASGKLAIVRGGLGLL